MHEGSGTDTTITGTDFDGLSRVFIQSGNGTTIPLTVKTSTSVTVTVPGNLAASEYESVVQTALGLSTQSPLGTRTDLFNVGPQITSLDPDRGPIAGGTPVTLHGTCFSTGGNGIQVTFGGKVAGLGFDQCVSHTECVVYSPPGPITGGTDILIYGGGFPPDKGLPTNLPLAFGNARTAARRSGNSVGETTVCRVTTPAVVTAGPVQVVGTAYGVNSATSNASVFTFDPYPQITKLVLPYPYPGLNPQSGLFLNGNAPSSGAAITITSSDQATVRADPQVVTIAPGRQWSDITLVTNPTPVAKHIIFVASYQGQSISAERDIAASPPVGIAVASQSLPFGVSQAVTVTLNTAAPVGGVTVQVTADDPAAVGMVNPTLVSIPAGSYSASFTLIGGYTTKDLGKWVDLTARYGVQVAKTAVFVSSPQKPPKPCKKKICPKGYFQTPDGCGCQKGLPQ